MNGKFVAYYRVSTQRQGRSGLGLEAQREAVTTYLNGGRWALLAEYTETETGKGSRALEKRPALRAAIEHAKKEKARLLIAKLDRLARNTHFITSLQESNVDFVCADMPDANTLTIQLLAAVAQYEAELISQRTKAALKAAKRRGKVLGNPNLQGDNTKRSAEALSFARKLRPTIGAYQRQGLSQVDIVHELNALGVKAPRGGQWSRMQLQRVINRLGTTQ